MASGFDIHVWSVSLLATFAGGALAATAEAAHPGRCSESSPLLRNIRSEFLRLGCDITLHALPETTADYLYVDPPWNAAGEHPLIRRLQTRAEWHRDAGFIHGISHHGSNLGFREKRSPSLHISVYPNGYFGKHTSQQHIHMLMQRTQDGALRGHSLD